MTKDVKLGGKGGAFYLHCKTCATDGLPNDLEVLTDKVALQVWCRRHQREVARFECNLPNIGCDACKAGIPHTHEPDEERT